MSDVYVALGDTGKIIGIGSSLDNAKRFVAEYAELVMGQKSEMAWQFHGVNGYWQWRDITIIAYRVDLGRVITQEYR